MGVYSNTGLFSQTVDAFGDGVYDPSIAPALQLSEKGVSAFAPFTGVIAQTVEDTLMDTTVTQVATDLNLYAIMLCAGDVVNNFNCISVGAASTPAHWWFCLATSTFYPVAYSADQTTTATAADSKVTVPVATVGVGASGATGSTPQAFYTVPATGLYYVGLMQAPTTTAFTIQGHTANGAGRGAFAPYLGFVSNTSASTVPVYGTALTSSAKTTPTAIAGIYLN